MKPTPFPDDLVELQTAFNRTYAALAAPHPAHARGELRRRLLRLSSRLWWHPFWTAPHRAPATRAQLRHHVRAVQGAAR